MMIETKGYLCVCECVCAVCAYDRGTYANLDSFPSQLGDGWLPRAASESVWGSSGAHRSDHHPSAASLSKILEYIPSKIKVKKYCKFQNSKFCYFLTFHYSMAAYCLYIVGVRPLGPSPTPMSFGVTRYRIKS